MNLHTSYPTAVFCIIATEFCERFSFCGLRTILSLYLRNVLVFSENKATVVYHVFIMLCYVAPIAGAICADSFIGRYRTIKYFAIMYLIGNVIMCLAAIPPINMFPIMSTVLGLILMAIGTGGLKPCVAAFGGEQFCLPDQEELLRNFFSVFYFTINLGGFVGMILTPILKKSVSCFGDDTCYALGFGFPASLMLLSIALFVMGKKFYKLKTPKRNILLDFLKCIFYALAMKAQCKTTENHWLDYGRDKFSNTLIEDMKNVCKILLIYTPLPLFWSLFDQQGSRWTFQVYFIKASHMDGNVFGTQIVPDQMQVVNPAMVLMLIPCFHYILNYEVSRRSIFDNSLHRMSIGGVAAGLAFLSAGVLELVLERTYPNIPTKDYTSINIINTLPCDVHINYNRLVKPGEIYTLCNLICYNCTLYEIDIEGPRNCKQIHLNKQNVKITIETLEYQVYTVLIGINSNYEIEGFNTDPVDFKKSPSGAPRLRIAYLQSTSFLHNISISLRNSAGLEDIYFVHDALSRQFIFSSYMEVPQGRYLCQITSNEKKILYERNFQLSLGGVYSLIIRERNQNIEFAKIFIMSPPNSVNILWQVPQYFLISVAEIMFGISGLEFSYTQAPRCMKTITIAGWYLSVAAGNLIVIIVTQLNIFRSQAYEFFLFAVLIMAVMMYFMDKAVKYKFVQIADNSTSCFIEDNFLQNSID